MKRLLPFLFFSWTWLAIADGPVVQTTPLSRQLLRAPDVGTARSVLGILVTNVGSITNQTLVTPTMQNQTANGGTFGNPTNAGGSYTGGGFTGPTISGGTNNADVIGGQQTNSVMAWILNVSPTNQIPNEYWFSPTNSGGYLSTGLLAGGNTRANPLYGDFDAFERLLTPNSVANLLPGNYWTVGNNGFSSNADLPAGVTIKGAGQSSTFINRTNTYDGLSGAFVHVFHSDHGRVTVQDLTVRVNAPTNNSASAFGAIFLYNNGNTIRNVVTVRGYGSTLEGFQNILGNSQTAINNSFENCTVSNFLGNYGDAVQISGSGWVRDNRIYYDHQTNATQLFGINVANGLNLLVRDNIVVGGEDGVHLDTGGLTNASFSGNQFIGCVDGIFLGDQDIGDVIVANNDFEISTNYFTSTRGAVRFDLNTKLENISIVNNIIKWENNVRFIPDPNQCGIFLGPTAQPASNIVIIANQIDANLPNNLNGQLAGWPANLRVNDNIPLYGTILQGLTNSIGLELTNWLESMAQNLPQPAQAQNELNGGQLFNFSFVEGTGTNVHDFCSSYPIGGVTFTPKATVIGGGFMQWTNGQCGYGLSMTNNAPSLNYNSGLYTNCLSYPLAKSLSLASNFTFSICFLQTNVPGGTYAIPFEIHQDGGGDIFDVGVPNNGVYTEFNTTTTNVGFTTVTATPVTDNTWHHLAVTFDGKNLKFYLDSTLTATIAATGTLPNFTSSGATIFFDVMQSQGMVQNFQGFGRTLNANEVKLLYRQEFSP